MQMQIGGDTVLKDNQKPSTSKAIHDHDQNELFFSAETQVRIEAKLRIAARALF